MNNKNSSYAVLGAICLSGVVVVTVACNRTPANPADTAPKPTTNSSITTPIGDPVPPGAPTPNTSGTSGTLPNSVPPTTTAPATSRPSPSTSLPPAFEPAPHSGPIEVATGFDPVYLNHAVLDMPQGRTVKSVAAEAKDKDANKEGGTLTESERSFLIRAGNNGEAEEEAALYVASKTTNNEIRGYASQLGLDLGKANEQLRKLAVERGVNLSADPKGPSRVKLDKLRQMSKGPALDRIYLQDFGVDALADAISLFEQQAGQGNDKKLKDYADKVLSKLRSHYSKAKDLQQKNVIKNSRLSM